MKLRVISPSLFLLFMILSSINATNGLGVTVLDGNVYIEGVMSLYPFEDGHCGGPINSVAVQNMESIRWTFMELNKDKDISLYGKLFGKYKYFVFSSSEINYYDHFPSVVCPFTPLNDFSSEPPGPIFFKLLAEPSVEEGLNVCTNDHGLLI